MAGRRVKLTPELEREITTYIRAGAYDHVAASAVGISRATFYRWYNEGANPRSQFASFRKAVDGAKAFARVRAETSVHGENPLAWLRYGPGRERPGQPGWTSVVRPEFDEMDDDALEVSLKRYAEKYGLGVEELRATFKDLMTKRDRLKRIARDPDASIEQPNE